MRPTTRPFASIVQASLIGLMLLSFFLIGQQWSTTVYHVGLVLLIGSTLVQIAFSNISPSATFIQSMKGFALAMLIVAALFTLGILLTPYLVILGQG